GVEETRATNFRVRPRRRLMRLDLPTLDLPEKAICGRRPGGGASGFAMAPAKLTVLMITLDPGEEKREGHDAFRRHASFIFASEWRTRSGGIPSVTHSAVVTISRTSSRDGASNITSRISPSSTGLTPPAPGPRPAALLAIP